LWHQKSFVVITDIFKESSKPDDVFTNNFLLGFFKAFVGREFDSIIISDFEIVLIVIDFYPVLDDLIEICLQIIDDIYYFLLIIVINI